MMLVFVFVLAGLGRGAVLALGAGDRWAHAQSDSEQAQCGKRGGKTGDFHRVLLWDHCANAVLAYV
jgi:hypothetical protein